MRLRITTTGGSADVGDAPAGHAGYVAGRYRDGAYSDVWTDVARCAERTFVGYAPACSCGWRGPGQPATAAGRLTCWRLWAGDHVGGLRPAAVAQPVDGR
jgi:hypothetical protein